MTYKDEIKEFANFAGELLLARFGISDSRTVSEQFDRTKKISDFVGFLTRLMFLSAIQAFIYEASKHSTVFWQIMYGIVGAILVVVQSYFSYCISLIVTKAALKVAPEKLGIDMSFRLGKNRPTVVFVCVLIFLQVVYFGVNSTLRDAVARGTNTNHSQTETPHNTPS